MSAAPGSEAAGGLPCWTTGTRRSTDAPQPPVDPADRHPHRPGRRERRLLERALGVGAHPAPDEPPFTSLEGGFGGLGAAVQAVDDAPRYHLDVETDDVEAETARLLALGAVEVSRWLECRTLRVPGGQLLCVIPVHSNPETFAALARTRP